MIIYCEECNVIYLATPIMLYNEQTSTKKLVIITTYWLPNNNNDLDDIEPLEGPQVTHTWQWAFFAAIKSSKNSLQMLSYFFDLVDFEYVQQTVAPASQWPRLAN